MCLWKTSSTREQGTAFAVPWDSQLTFLVLLVDLSG
jgi:hypothetical protein